MAKKGGGWPEEGIPGENFAIPTATCPHFRTPIPSCKPFSIFLQTTSIEFKIFMYVKCRLI